MKYSFGFILFLLLFSCEQKTKTSIFSRQNSCSYWPAPKLKKVIRPGDYYLESLFASIDSVERIVADKTPKTIAYPLPKNIQKIWYNNRYILKISLNSSVQDPTFEHRYYVFDQYHWCNETIHYYEPNSDSITKHQFYSFRKNNFLFALSEVMTAPGGQFYVRLTNNKYLQSKARNICGRFSTELRLYGI